MDIDARLADDSGHQESPIEAVVKHYASLANQFDHWSHIWELMEVPEEAEACRQWADRLTRAIEVEVATGLGVA